MNMESSVAIIGASGQFGKVFARRFTNASWQVYGVDLCAADSSMESNPLYTHFQLEKGDTSFSPCLRSALAVSNVILLCVPIAAAQHAAEVYAECMAPG